MVKRVFLIIFIKDMSQGNCCNIETVQIKQLQTTQRFRLSGRKGSKIILLADLDLTKHFSAKPLNLMPSREFLNMKVKQNFGKLGNQKEEVNQEDGNSFKNGEDLEEEKIESLNIQDLPHPKTKFCAVCGVKFANYYQHVLEKEHKSKFQKDPRAAELNQFIYHHRIHSQTIFQSTKEAEIEPIDKLSRRPSLEDHKEEEKNNFLGIPQKRKKQMKESSRTLRENGNIVSSTNIFQFSLSENPVSFRRS